MNIKGNVQKLVSKYHTNNPFCLCELLGIEVYYEDLGQLLGYYDVHFRMKSIHINYNAPDELYPFICAHELGHAILHPKLNTPFLSKYTMFSIDKIERQANTFAVELLLPDELLFNHYDINFSSLALSHGVPRGLELLKYSFIIGK